MECVAKIAKKNVDIIVIACNTATSVAIEEIRNKYPNICIIGTEPAIKVAHDENNHLKKVIIAGTSLTVKEEKLIKLVKKLEMEDKVECISLDRLVDFAERLEFDSIEVKKYLGDQFAKYNLEEFSHLILGCTHFPLFIETLSKILPSHIKIIDSSRGVVENIKRNINNYCNGKSTVTLLMTKSDNIMESKFRKITSFEDFNSEVV